MPIEKIVEGTRNQSWKFIGALFMEEKNGVQAVSLHKVLALSTYIACMWLWLGVGRSVAPEVAAVLAAAKIDVPNALRLAGAVPDSLLWTLWGLLAINGGAKIAGIAKGNVE